MKAKIVEQTQIAQSERLNLSIIDWIDERGRARKWESADRNHQHGAVMIIPVIEPQNELILIRQFRPPAHGYMIEFPAGLIDPGEDAQTAAKRELFEECGYHGEICAGGIAAYSSPGFTGEPITPIWMVIDGEIYPDAVSNHPEDSENIEVFRVPMEKLSNFITKMVEEGCKIDSKVYCFAIALNMPKRVTAYNEK